MGTSQATPVAAGVAALIVSKFAREGLTPYEVEYRLKRGVKPIDDYNPEYKGKLGVGCVNALLALSDEPINFLPVITAQKPIEGVQIIPYGSTAQYVYTVSDTEDGTDLDYVLKTPAKSVTATKQRRNHHVDSEQQELHCRRPHCKIDGDRPGRAFKHNRAFH